MNKKSFFILFLFFNSIYFSQSSGWFEETSLNSIVLIQKYQDGKYLAYGTGFLLYNYETEGEAILVTCAHLFKRRDFYVVVRPDSSLKSTLINSSYNSIVMGKNVWELHGDVLRTKIILKEDSSYILHDSLDIGALLLGLATKISLNIGDSTVIRPITKTSMLPRSVFKGRNKIGLGTDIYFVGFPFGIGTSGGYFEAGLFSEKIPTPLIRSGIIAWVSDSNKEFLLDSFSYGGNSGSPVFTKRTFNQPGPMLIGMVTGHLGPEVENFGLAKCLWIDDIQDVVKKLFK